VCALAALASGEQHPLLTVVAEHSVALLGVVRALLENAENTENAEQSARTAPPDGPPPPPEPPDGDQPPPGPGRYQHIPVTVEE
jgi:hypothetical protein